MESKMKKWGAGEYWGVSSDYDPDWLLTEKQKKLRDDLIELCRVKIRPFAGRCDKEYLFPREALDAMGELGLLGLIVPPELGGLGESHVFMAVIVETLARYGCPSTAMVYTMHLVACGFLLGCHEDHAGARDLLARVTKEKLIGTISVSDPATGGHFWFPLSSKVKALDSETVQLLRYSSWITSAGHADFYAISTVSPNFDGDYANTSVFLVFKDEVRGNTEDWSALGMHGNMSGPMIIDGKFSLDRMLTSGKDAIRVGGECRNIFYMSSSSCWSGIAMACMDVARKHVTRKALADVGMRVCDYPTVQDYFGDAMIDTSSSRALLYFITEAVDKDTNNGQWTKTLFNRHKHEHWLLQVKFSTSKNVEQVSDKMLHACGGTGYKMELGLERLLRDGRAGWVMATSNEVIRQHVGKTVLEGVENVSFMEQRPNERVLNQEIMKLSVDQKKKLAKSLLEDVETEEQDVKCKHPFQETDFDNPFNTCPPAASTKTLVTSDGQSHAPALRPGAWLPLKLKTRKNISSKMTSFVFALPGESDHTGCLPGQYVAVRITTKEGKEEVRYFSPVSRPDDFGRLELMLRFETHGIMSQHFQSLQPADEMDFQGPCGGFEYLPNHLDELTLLTSGPGITPGMQIIRSLMHNVEDKTKINLLYFAENYDEILFRKELEQYRASDSRLRVMFTLGEPPEQWEGEEGFIDSAMINKYVTKPNEARHQVVLCGGPSMVLSSLYSLRALGFPSHHIFVYGQLGTEMVKAVYGRKARLSSHRCDESLNKLAIHDGRKRHPCGKRLVKEDGLTM